jgi:hypothetical protein
MAIELAEIAADKLGDVLELALGPGQPCPTERR